MAKRTKVTKREIDLATGVVLGHIIYDAMSDLTRMIIADELRWITIHPNGKGAKLSNGEEDVKGKPVLIDTETGKIVGGAIPQSLHGVKLQSKEERDKNGSKSFKEIIKSSENQTNAPDNITSGSNNAAEPTVEPNSDPASYARDPNADIRKLTSDKSRHSFLQERVKSTKPISLDATPEQCAEYLKAIAPNARLSISSKMPKESAAHITKGFEIISNAFPLLGANINAILDKKAHDDEVKQANKELLAEYNQHIKKLETDAKEAFKKDEIYQRQIESNKSRTLNNWFDKNGGFNSNLMLTRQNFWSLSKATKQKLIDFFEQNGLNHTFLSSKAAPGAIYGDVLNKYSPPQDLKDSIKEDLLKREDKEGLSDYIKFYSRSHATLTKPKTIKSIYEENKDLLKSEAVCLSGSRSSLSHNGIRTQNITNAATVSNIFITNPYIALAAGEDPEKSGQWFAPYSAKHSLLTRTAVHEMAHALHSMIDKSYFGNNNQPTAFRQMYDNSYKNALGEKEYQEMVERREGKRGAALFRPYKSYKHANEHEFFAEMITEALLSDNPSKEAKEVFAEAKKLYNKLIV